MNNYHRLTRQLLATDPDNPDWIMELSYSHNNLAALQLYSGKEVNEETLAHVAEAIRLVEKVVAMKPGDQAVADNYATLLAWAADAEVRVCNLGNALKLRDRTKFLAESSARSDPGNNDLKKRRAYAYTGVARVQTSTGSLTSAVQNLEIAISILQELSAADPSNIHYSEQAFFRQVMLAKLLADTGQFELARSLMKVLEPGFGLPGELADLAIKHPNEYIEFMNKRLRMRLGMMVNGS